jgi:hypothetical protein
MFWIRFLQIIENSFIGKFAANKLAIIEKTDPDRIYVENIRSFFNFPTSLAKFYCELAVKKHVFNKKIAINCPHCGRVIKTVNKESEIPKKLSCTVCELDEQEEYEFVPDKKDIAVFYQLNRETDAS